MKEETEYRTNLKAHIKAKFGFISRFAALAELDLYQTNKMLDYAPISALKQLKKKADSLKNIEIPGKELSTEHKAVIVEAILSKYRTRSAFCIKKKYDNAYISHVTGNKRVRITGKLKKLCSTLGVSL